MSIKENDTKKEEQEKLIKIIENYEQILKNSNLLKDMIPKIDTVNNIKNTKMENINNGTINNGIVNNTTINNIVQFGKEDITKLDLQEMITRYSKSTGCNIYPDMLKYINLNPNFPENNNICISDLAREIVKIYNGKKFVSKKFKNVKNEILGSISNHIMNMCTIYMENPKIKKSQYIIDKIKKNNISTKLINNDDITQLFTIKKYKKSSGEESESESEDYESEYLDDDGEKKVEYYEKKRKGLQIMTIEKIKDELYNNRELVEN
jgi:hypothetical protein